MPQKRWGIMRCDAVWGTVMILLNDAVSYGWVRAGGWNVWDEELRKNLKGNEKTQGSTDEEPLPLATWQERWRATATDVFMHILRGRRHNAAWCCLYLYCLLS